jgi:hypothetical protein
MAMAGPWKIRNNPGHWGSSNPSILVLGFSKGSTQADVHATGAFEDVPFAKARHRLTTVLQTVGILGNGENVEEKLRADEPDMAFASLVRCSPARWDKRSNGYTTSGAIVTKALRSRRHGIFSTIVPRNSYPDCPDGCGLSSCSA